MSSSTAFSAYPPLRKRASTHIRPSRALSLLSAYLAASAQDASLHPNAVLTESGPKATAAPSSSGGHRAGTRRSGGVVLHNLRRVEAGLKGEYLGAEGGFTRQWGKEREESGLGADGFREGSAAAVPAGEVGGGLEEEDEWQDREEFEREQVVVGGGALGEKTMEVERRDREVNDMNKVEVPRVKETSRSLKEERKMRKKERRKKEQREAQMKREQRERAEG